MTRPFIALFMLLAWLPAAHAQSWVKSCEKTTTTVSGYEGRIVCLTYYHQYLDNTGKLVVSVALREIEGHETRSFMILVPLGTLLEPGLRVTIFPKEVWEKALKNNGRPDATNLKEITLMYTLCHAGGCVAEVEATPDLISDLRDSGGLMVLPAAVDAYPIPLKGFADALLGQPRNRELPQQRRRCDEGNWPGCTDR